MSKSAVIETQSGKPSRLSKLYEKAVIGQLGRIQKGCIHLHTAGEVYELGDPSADLSISLTVYDRRFFEAVVQGGSVGAAESYMQGDWHCSDLTALVRILVRNQSLTDELEQGFARITGALLKGFHWLNRNSRKGSRKNIAAHYDLGSDLFELFLDKDWMMYLLKQLSGKSWRDCVTSWIYSRQIICWRLVLGGEVVRYLLLSIMAAKSQQRLFPSNNMIMLFSV